jgi:hypothetical protein
MFIHSDTRHRIARRQAHERASQESAAGVVAEGLRSPVVGLQGLHTPVTRNVHDLEHVGAVLECGGDEARAQAVAGEDFGVEAGGFRPRLDDERDLIGREASGQRPSR